MTKDEALKLALEALEEAWYHVGTFQPTEKAIDLYDEARTAIKEALAQPEQEPVAYQQRTRPNWKDATCWTPWEDCSKAEAQDCWDRPQAHDWLYEARALYTTPPQRKPLTENEIKHLWYEACQTNLELTSQLIVHLARNIEAAHGIKGQA